MATGTPPGIDSLGHTMTSVVINPYFGWASDRAPRTPYHETVIYEAHVKGMTQTHPGVPEELRGTYAGLGHPAVIDHLKSLNVTAIELMPVHQFLHDHRLMDLGLRNYWGYNTFGFFAPHYQYSSSRHAGGAVAEFKTMVRSFHEAGIEVILDVVYNHTAEGDHLGPTINFRGIDNAGYYRLLDGDLRFYKDFTGTGNSLNARHPHTLQLIMDSLRYWVLEMHVDGFRFDLAATLAREFYDVDRLSAFFDLVQQDPVVSQVKLIAEPWDIGEGGYQVGNFPGLWTEWNGKYRDTVRDYWRGEPATLGEFASRLTGSSDLYEATGRRPSASINFVTCHDGFTLNDLVSYNEKHNEANGEDNRDGESHNRSWNCGVEGPTDDPDILALRGKQMRNIMGTLMLSQGTPMLSHGDEIGRTQKGNNNVYCQDSETVVDGLVTVRDQRRPAGVHPQGDRVAQKPPRVPPAALLRGQADPQRRPGPRHRLAHPGGQGDDTARTGVRASTSAWRCSSTATRSRHRTNAASGWSTTPSCCASTPMTRSRISLLRKATTPRSGPPTWTPPTRRATQTWWSPRARRSRCNHGHFWCCVRPPDAWLLVCCRRIDCRCAATAFTFADAEDLLPYLDDLGVSHLYLSPILTAVRDPHTDMTSPIPQQSLPSWAGPRGWPGCRRRHDRAAWG